MWCPQSALGLRPGRKRRRRPKGGFRRAAAEHERGRRGAEERGERAMKRSSQVEVGSGGWARTEWRAMHAEGVGVDANLTWCVFAFLCMCSLRHTRPDSLLGAFWLLMR
jgi:hypothetical protein